MTFIADSPTKDRKISFSRNLQNTCPYTSLIRTVSWQPEDLKNEAWSTKVLVDLHLKILKCERGKK